MKKNVPILLIAILALFASCGDNNEPARFYTVTFETDGGTPVPPVQRVEEGGTATAPSTNPAKTGYLFVHWHVSGATAAYNFQTPVKADITLKARWQEEAGAEYWQVAWELNGGAWPSDDNHATKALKGGTLAEPAEPVKSGSTFEGWYKEADLTNKVAFPYDVSNVTADITLYAKWKNEGGGESNAFTIRNTTDWSNAVSAIRAGGANKSYILTIEGTVSIPPTTGVDQTKPHTYTFGEAENVIVTLKGSGILALSGKGFLICMTKKEGLKQKLIVDGPTLQGRSDNTVPLLRFDYADLELKSGKITGNTNNGGGGSGDGGGVAIKNGNLIMSGGEISNNTCGQKSYVADGGGAAITDGNFTMSGGTISGNTGGDGGGVYLHGFDFTMSGGIIKGNTSRSSSPMGGGVFYRRDESRQASFTKTGGIICGSDAVEADRNKVVAFDGTAYTNRGAAVFYLLGFLVSETSTKRRETTLGENDNITTDNNTGWGI